RSIDIVATILAAQPQIVGLGIYIWNVEAATHVVADLKRVRPDICVVLGGPEVSHETESQTIIGLADYVITGEADLEFPALCRRLLAEPLVTRQPENQNYIALNGDSSPRIIHAAVPSLSEVRLPYDLYADEDIAHRVIYVEVSRGCPFTCEFCLSALDIPVRLFDVDQFLAAMQSLLERGVRSFKFVDRTFNLNMRITRVILQFFLDRCDDGLFLHFEMIPDRLPDSLREIVVQFPAGVLQFEIGVQTFNDDVGELISRQQDDDQLSDNFRFLRQQSGVHIHADLIIGLPGETVESFAAGFDRLVELRP
ncbi:MAG: B12-binding domain-containing radical SAM protein, partial [Fuerstiella sp.]|nr:B12-binding domain-containing radical SAM protein [Fuerstiella sp.]